MPESAVQDKEQQDKGRADTDAILAPQTPSAMSKVHGKRSGSKAQQNGGNISPGVADHPQDSEPLDSGGSHHHPQPGATPDGVNSMAGTADGRQPIASTPQQAGCDISRQNTSRQSTDPSHQDAAGQRTHNGAFQPLAGHPQEPQSPSPQDSGHPHMQKLSSMQGLSSRRRSMERQTASLTLPFEQLNFAFHHINYSVPATNADDPRNEGNNLMLLRDVSGAFRPHRLACLMGASGAGKTTLMDCLAGRKTSGKVEGEMTVNGHPKNQQTFSRVCGYVEQNDIHAPGTTVYEALEFSAQMRILDLDKHKLKAFVDQVVELMELGPLAGALVGSPGQSGLSVEQRKRLTIGVELCANPSVIFMDEPTSGLDARAAAIVMRTVRNTVNTGRTVVCTIHQPSIDIFESFDELVLLKPGGRMIYCGSTGHNSKQLVEYFQSLKGVPRVQEGVNPATWMLEVTRAAEETRLRIDFAEVYTESDLFRNNEELVEKLKQPPEGSQPLQFKSRYSRKLVDQFWLLLLRNSREYWRMPDYNTVRIYFTCLFGLVLGVVYWRIGTQRTSPEGIGALCGAMLLANIFLGTSNSSTVQPVVGQQRSILYRERAAGYYATYPFALAQFLIEIPYVLAQSVFFSVITYFMVYFYIDAGKFFWYFFFVFLNLLFFTSWGIIAVALTPNIQISAVLSSGVYTFWFIFGGFIVPRPQIHGWWIWYYFLDPLAYTIWGLIGSQLSDVSDVTLVSQTGMRMALNEYMTTTYKFRHAFIGAAAAILIAFIVLFHLLTAFALQKLNYLKR
ncbi:hypothetical protein ABBQ38_012275 [Trebouxia sp. C0009 RCD-2024]